MKKLMSLLLSSVLCLSLVMPTVAFGADDNIIELNVNNSIISFFILL